MSTVVGSSGPLHQDFVDGGLRVCLSGLAHTTAWECNRAITTPKQPARVLKRCSSFHIREEGCREIELGAFYRFTTAVAKKRPEQLEVRAQESPPVRTSGTQKPFRWRLWPRSLATSVSPRCHSRAKSAATSDGAHRIWRLMEDHSSGGGPDCGLISYEQYICEGAWSVCKERSDCRVNRGTVS